MWHLPQNHVEILALGKKIYVYICFVNATPYSMPHWYLLQMFQITGKTSLSVLMYKCSKLTYGLTKQLLQYVIRLVPCDTLPLILHSLYVKVSLDWTYLLRCSHYQSGCCHFCRIPVGWWECFKGAPRCTAEISFLPAFHVIFMLLEIIISL